MPPIQKCMLIKILEGFVDAAQAASVGKNVVLRHGIFCPDRPPNELLEHTFLKSEDVERLRFI